MQLNDEQEKALREWWRVASKHILDDDSTVGEWMRVEKAALVALRPLMEPWRVYDAVVNGPGDLRVICYSDREGRVTDADRAFAARVCRLLNESESSR